MWVAALLIALCVCVFGPLLAGAAYERRRRGGSYWARLGPMMSGLFGYVSRNIWSSLALLMIVCLTMVSLVLIIEVLGP